jgi:hypothetical protein
MPPVRPSWPDYLDAGFKTHEDNPFPVTPMQGTAQIRTPPISGELGVQGETRGAASKAFLGELLTLGSGFLGTVFWALYLTVWPTALGVYGYAPAVANGTVIGVVGLFLSLVALTGGWFGYQKKNRNLALLGGLMGFLSFGFGIGSLLGLVGLILAILGKAEYQ